MVEIVPSNPIVVADMPHRAASDYKRVYANNATMTMTFFDAGLTFGETVFDQFGQPPYIEDRVTVSMAWEHMKALHDAIGKILESYETSQGVKVRDSNRVITAPRSS